MIKREVASTEAALNGQDSVEKVNILIVDDNLEKLIAHEAVLADLGERVVKATSGEEALQLLLKYDFAVILLDVNMPGMDGFETAHLIRQRPRSETIPIIFVTGFNTTDIDRLQGYRLGAVDYLFLPVTPEVLKAKVGVFVCLERQRSLIRTQADRLAQHNREQAAQLDEIQRLNRDLSSANLELEAFSYTVAHDLRAPLRALLGYAAVLQEDHGEALGKSGNQALTRLVHSVQQMDSLTRDLLSYNRVVRQSVEPEAVELGPLFDEIVALSPRLQPPASDIVIDPVPARVIGQPTLLRQIFANLLENAVKFVHPANRPSVRVRNEPNGTRIRIWVEDNGIGIDPTFHERIFGIFERAGNVRDYEGTGIGLAIVARAVQRLGGHYGVVSTLGQGSRFWIELSKADQENLDTNRYETVHHAG